MLPDNLTQHDVEHTMVALAANVYNSSLAIANVLFSKCLLFLPPSFSQKFVVPKYAIGAVCATCINSLHNHFWGLG